MKKVKTATFNGTSYEIDLAGGSIDGSCDNPKNKGKPVIYIAARPNSLAELRSLLHEMKHAGNWMKSEESVTRQAEEEARLLWRLGYRRMK